MGQHPQQAAGQLVPEHGIGGARARIAGPSSSKACTGPAVTAPDDHRYGGNSQDQPRTSPIRIVSTTSRPSPGAYTSRWTEPDWISQQRVARRRAELRLERYPARPAPEALRHLAAALRTTPARLLSGGAETPPGQFRLERAPEVIRLSTAECRRLLAPGGAGRIAFCGYSGPAILPDRITGRRIEA